MFRYRFLVIVAMLCSAVLWSMSAAPVNAATLPDLSTQFQITSTVPDVTAANPAIPTTWGGIKVLFGGDKGDGPSDAPRLIPGSHDWSNNTLSEAFYSISTNRSGDYGNYYQGWTMSQKGWDYPHNDGKALDKVTWWLGSGNVGPLGLWNGFQQGGWCRFFSCLVLYRSSYGYGDGWHLVIPRSGTSYATHSTREAGIGWVLQSPSLHTALVVAVYSNGLDLVDSNYTGSYKDNSGWHYSYAISRHLMTWTKLDADKYMAYCPWVDGYSNGNQGFLQQ